MTNKQKTHCKRGHDFSFANTRTFGGRRRCMECHRVDNRSRYHQKALWKTRNYDWISLTNILRTYDLTLDQYHALQESHDFHCAICDESKGLCVDHNHKTGKVRGLLCFSHNVAIGHFAENTSDMKSAISYLEKHACL